MSDNTVGLVPPGREIAMANSHWVRRKHALTHEMEVWQWQPGVKQWCRPSEIATGRNFDLVDYDYVARCPTPPFPSEMEVFSNALEKLRRGVPYTKLTESECEIFNRLIFEQVMVYPRK